MSDGKFDRYSGVYQDIVNDAVSVSGFDAAYFAARKVELVRSHPAVRGRRNEPLRILDAGCGIGLCEPHFARLFPNARIRAIDPSRESIEVARRMRLDRVSFDIFDRQSLPGGPFDLAFTAGVLHHLAPQERLRLLKLLFHCLAPGGTLFVFEHNPLNPFTRKIVRSCRLDDSALLLRAGEARALLREAGFTRESIRFIFFFPALLRFLVPLERGLGSIPLGAQYYIAACK